MQVKLELGAFDANGNVDGDDEDDCNILLLPPFMLLLIYDGLWKISSRSATERDEYRRKMLFVLLLEVFIELG